MKEILENCLINQALNFLEEGKYDESFRIFK